MVSDAASPAIVFTSTGKNTMTTTTAAFDCQSKPNHITRIGAMPTIGRAATKLPTGSSPRLQEGRAVNRNRRRHRRRTANRIAAERALEEGLHQIGPQDRQAIANSRQHIAGRRQDDAIDAISRTPASQSTSTVSPKISGTA